jgi:hypothetical protein
VQGDGPQHHSIPGGSSTSLNLHPGKSISDVSGTAEGFLIGYLVSPLSRLLTLAELIDFGRRVHLIPLTVTYKEVYNIHMYFSIPTESTTKSSGLMLPEVGPEAREGDKHHQRIVRAEKQ